MASGSSRCPVWQTLRVNAVDAVFEERWCLGAGERGNPATVSSHGRSAIESRCWSTPAASTRSWWCCAAPAPSDAAAGRSEEHTSELQSRPQLVCRLLLEKKKQ